MSELKAIRSGEIYNIIEYEDCYRTDDLYYPKSEADKVIALLSDKANYNEYAYKNKKQELVDTCQFYEEEIRHQKYKRCFAMAEMCMHKRWRTDEGFDYARSTRHMNKWLEIAEKFKPNNSTAQQGKGKQNE